MQNKITANKLKATKITKIRAVRTKIINSAFEAEGNTDLYDHKSPNRKIEDVFDLPENRRVNIGISHQLLDHLE